MSQYFSSSNKRGELNELNEDLNSTKYEKKKEAIKKVIAYMTIGKDVSTLFQSVIKCLELNDIEIIKLVYLYVINYSRTKPDDAIMVVQLFRKDCANKTSPLIRALAVRTMGCIRVKKINEYLIEPLKEALNDDDPYVKKTAVLCVPKVYDVSPELVEAHGIFDILNKIMNKEGNAFVVANLVACLHELSEMKGKNLLNLNSSTVSKLLLAMNDCIEWGQIFILDSIVTYVPADSKEAESIIDRVIPRLSHINPSVVLSGVKVILKFMDYLTNVDAIKSLCRKVSPSLVSLLNTPPEIQYIVLRNINFMVEKRPHLLEKEIKIFFVKFNDPYYVKLEKLNILTKLCEARNFEIVMNELNEYASEIDPEFSRKALKAIGKITLKVDKSNEKCISVLKNIIGECKKAPHVLQEAAIVFQIIYRKYPEKFVYDNVMKEMFESFDIITESEPRGSLTWLIGEFSEKITKTVDILNDLCENFLEESQFVQLQILTACVKTFLKAPDTADALITRVLELSSEKNDNPDVRDRGYIYWRMLSTDTELAKKVVLSERPVINEDQVAFEPSLLDNLIQNISMVSSVFHKQADSLIPKSVIPVAKRAPEEEEEEVSNADNSQKKDENKEKDNTKVQDDAKTKEDDKKEVPKEKKKIEIPKPGTKLNPPSSQPKNEISSPNQTQQTNGNLLNLLDDIIPTKIENNQPQPSALPIPATTTTTQATNNLLDIFDTAVSPTKTTNNIPNTNTSFNPIVTSQPEIIPTFQSPTSIESSTPVPYEVILRESVAGTKNGRSGMKLEGAFLRENQKTVLGLKITNFSNQVLSDFDAQLKPNYFGLKIDSFPAIEIPPNQNSVEIKLTINNKGPVDNAPPTTPLTLTLGIKNNLDIFYSTIPCMFHVLLDTNGELKQDDFKKLWKEIPNANELMYEQINLNPSLKSADALKRIFKKNNIFFLAGRKNKEGQEILYFTSRCIDGTYILSEVTFPSTKNPNGCSISCRCLIQSIIPLYLMCAGFILSN